ncbi:MAG: hypothetical protein ABI647_25660, partial [Gemmatimonadota bacterium]
MSDSSALAQAAKLAGTDGFQMLAAREHDKNENLFLLVRTRFFDDLLPANCKPKGQVVLLGGRVSSQGGGHHRSPCVPVEPDKRGAVRCHVML